MFAGAAREAVFSRPDVIAKVRAGFIPVALKAGLVNNPPPGPEGRLYRELGRSKPAPQGICAANSAGKVLAWALSFDTEAHVPAFLDHVAARYRKYDGTAERYRSFPGARLPDVADTGADLPVPAAHPDGTHCPALPRRVAGTIVARVVGRTLAKDGTPSTETRRQEHYAEDVFDIPPSQQAALLEAVAAAPPGTRVRVPAAFARLLVTYAYLGQLDVRPVASPVPGHRAQKETIEMWVRRDGPHLRLDGASDVRAGASAPRSDGATFHHDIRLRWRGFLTPADGRLTDLVLVAEGTETLRWSHPVFRTAGNEPDCAHLPAGRPLDYRGRVRYGLAGRPVPAAEATAETEAEAGPRTPPESLRRKMGDVQAGVQRWRRAGRDLAPVGTILSEFEPHVRAGRFADAEKVLDRALDALKKS